MYTSTGKLMATNSLFSFNPLEYVYAKVINETLGTCFSVLLCEEKQKHSRVLDFDFVILIFVFLTELENEYYY
jgi:hypothetical protein